MGKQDEFFSEVPPKYPSREELEMHLRARAWKDEAFRQEFLVNPKAVLQRDFVAWLPEGKIPSELSIEVVEEDEQNIYFVLPLKAPEDVLTDSEALEDDELSALSGGGVTDYGTCWSCDTCFRCTLRTCGVDCRTAIKITGNRL